MTGSAGRAAWPRFARFVGALAVLVATTGLLAAPASAHAALIGTDPANGSVLAQAPDEVRLTFNEPVRLVRDPVRLYDAAGVESPATAEVQGDIVVVDLPDQVAEGTHVLGWRVISTDGHPLSGNVTFSVGAPSVDTVAVPVADPVEAGTPRSANVVQALQYVGLLLAAGLVVFTVLLPASALRAGRTRLSRAMWGSAVVAGAASAGMAVIAWTVTPRLPAAELLAALLVVTGLAVAGLACRALPVSGPARRVRVVALLGAGLALGAPALVGHTRSTEPQLLLVAADVVHLVAGAIWFGGLVGLVLLLPRLRGEGATAARVLSRFSTVAATSLVVLFAMGSVLSWRIVSSWDNLLHTTYGALLLTKVAIVLAAVGVATANHFLLLPRFQRDVDGPGPQRRLRRAIAAEGSLLVVAVLLTGFLTNQAPHPVTVAPVAAAAPAPRTTQVGDVQVEVSLSSGVVGLNTLRLETKAADHGHHAADPHEPPVVRLRSADLDLGTVPLEQTSATTYEASVVLPEEGVWDVQVGIRVDEFDNPVTTVEFPVRAGSSDD